ncbi:YsnF/AvaK domain-containing protein [Pantoea vagans]|uniref:YsnF/AvaK domain-containing protein n=1 Tax=Pantoea vagans TaxID=470934 RepID=UPI0023AF5576|nr:YsnF/AvaK domain-containing protein [Pantoea vagans]MDE8558553.1 YsnF/AvaK domain-containing protein [Pantoea vagans]MDE8578599.1 YsnF/AvaK domain-containing protein [Pantoea vagans]
MNNQPPEKPVSEGSEQVLSLAEETVEVSKQRVIDGHVRITRQVTEHQQKIALMLRQQTADIQCISKSERLTEMPAIREENGVLIIPIVEEEVEIVRHLVLKEEWHIRKVVSEVETEQIVSLRRQQAHLTRIPYSEPSESITEEHNMARETIVTMFSNISLAEGAKRNLIKAGFLDDDIDIISGERLRTEGHEARHPGFWQRLFGNTLEEDQAEVYEDAMRTGGVVLSLRADEDELPRALGILDAHEELTERRVALPDDYAPDDGLTAPASGTLQENSAIDPLHTNSAHRGAARTALTGDESDEDVLRLAEERLEVGKRLVSEGSTRVRRYTVTDPVSENVSLHEQHAEIFRRPVNETGSPDQVDWSEKTVEVEETHEQPVVNKTAQIIEEVVLRKEASDRVETINDSVRRQEVDIDHARADHLNADPVTGNPAETDPLLESTRQARADHDSRPVTSGSEPAHKEGIVKKAGDNIAEAKDKVEDKFRKL